MAFYKWIIFFNSRRKHLSLSFLCSWIHTEAALRRCSQEKMLWKHVAILQENKLRFFGTPFSKNFSGELLLCISFMYFCKNSFWANFMAQKCLRFWILNHHEERDFLGISSFGILILRKGYIARCFNHFYKTDIQCALYSWVLNCASENPCWIMLGISWE